MHIIKKEVMKSSQINFYFTKEDILEIEEYIRERKMLIIPQPLYTKELNFSHSLTEYDGKRIWSDKYLVLEKDKNSVITKYIDTQNYYLVDVLDSPVIEFSNCIIKNNIMSRGRIYIVKNTYDKSGLSVDKPSEFLQTASELFKWIKKHFKPKNTSKYPPIPNMEGILISERVFDWMQTEKGNLAELVREDVKKRNVA